MYDPNFKSLMTGYPFSPINSIAHSPDFYAPTAKDNPAALASTGQKDWNYLCRGYYHFFSHG